MKTYEEIIEEVLMTHKTSPKLSWDEEIPLYMRKAIELQREEFMHEGKFTTSMNRKFCYNAGYNKAREELLKPTNESQISIKIKRRFYDQETKKFVIEIFEEDLEKLKGQDDEMIELCKNCNKAMRFIKLDCNEEGGFWRCKHTIGIACKCGHLHSNHFENKCNKCDCKNFRDKKGQEDEIK